ncbi:hypothetical protein [Rickettsia tamurae]|uniref:hypothetical protein n=1 Tax=Rickettsia tamurae TaxID=334545 RepID=UPI000ACB2CA4|nr:hypothetical protein [Rickettsia tamurae]
MDRIHCVTPKIIQNTDNFSIFNWIPWSSHGMTEVKLIHTTMPARLTTGSKKNSQVM